MNVAKNWALTIIAIALTFAHFSANCCLKKLIVIPVKKTLSNAGHIDVKIESILVKFAKKNPAKSAVFYWLFLGEVSPWSFPQNRPIFLRILRNLNFFPLKSCEIGWFFREFWLFSRKNPVKSADFSAILPLKIPRNFDFFPVKYQKPWLIAPAWADKKIINIIFSFDGHCISWPWIWQAQSNQLLLIFLTL